MISEDLDQTIIADNIRAHLNQYLPDYMCPSIIQKIDTFPLNPNGKVDRKALPEPNFSAQQHSISPPVAVLKIFDFEKKCFLTNHQNQ